MLVLSPPAALVWVLNVLDWTSLFVLKQCTFMSKQTEKHVIVHIKLGLLLNLCKQSMCYPYSQATLHEISDFD